MAYDTTLKIRRFPPSKRLGRNVVHDAQSRRFMAPAKDRRELASIWHKIRIGVMTQHEGSCTGHAGTNTLASDAFWAVGQPLLAGIDPHEYAVELYADATLLDPWPGQYKPDDTGSDGLSIAKVLKNRGLISGYQHAFSLDAALTALAERVVLLGLSWHSSMFEPDADGRLRISGPVEGGHEIAADQLDVENERVWFTNQWGAEWGHNGRAYFTFDDLGELLADQGDCTILIPTSEPAPQPAPVPPPPPEPERPTTADRMLAEALKRFGDNRAVPVYLAKAAKVWLPTVKE